MNRLLTVQFTTAALLAGASALHAQPAEPVPPGTPETPAPAQTLAPEQTPAPAIDLETPPPASLEIEGLAVEAGGLTASEVARRALAASSSVREKRAELQVANARIAQVTIEFVPHVNLRASYTYLPRVEAGFGQGALLGARNPGRVETAPCPDGSGETCVVDSMGEPVGAANAAFVFPEHNYALHAGLTVPLSDYILRVSDAAAGASASREAASYALQAEERKVRTDSRILYYNWLRAHAQVYIARKSLERTSARLEDARAALAVGRLANADVMRIEAVVANAALALQQAEALRALIGAQLAIVMRDTGGGEYRIGQGVPEVEAPEVTPELARKRIAEAHQNRLELKAVDAAARALGHGEQAARAGGWPRLEAVADGTYANPNARFFPPQDKWKATWSAGVQATFQLDAPFMSDARGDELAASREATLGRRVGLEGAIANEVVTSQVDVVKARAALAASAVSVRASEESYRVTTDRFQVGRATPTDLIDVENELLAAKLTVVNAKIDLVIASLRLDYALGHDDRSAVAAK